MSNSTYIELEEDDDRWHSRSCMPSASEREESEKSEPQKEEAAPDDFKYNIGDIIKVSEPFTSLLAPGSNKEYHDNLRVIFRFYDGQHVYIVEAEDGINLIIPEHRAQLVERSTTPDTPPDNAPEVEQPKKKAVDLIPEERLQELLNILLPWGYCNHEPHKYTGVSPYIGSTKNIITIVANDPEGWGGVFSICMDRFAGDEYHEEGSRLGFYKGIMKVIAPELYSTDKKFNDTFNVLSFEWADDDVWNNRFPAKI